MSNLQSAFDFILHTQGRSMTYEKDAGAESDTLVCAPSNFFRNLSAIEETPIEGKEFVISKREFDNSSFTRKFPERSDVIVDPDLGENAVSEVRELMIFGVIVGYRLRTT